MRSPPSIVPPDQAGHRQRGTGPTRPGHAIVAQHDNEPRMRARFAGLTDVGLIRERNEDSLLVFPEYRFAAVADGMGGHLSGDVASALAISTLQDFYSNTVGPDRTWPFPYDQELTEEENCMVTGVRLANRQVFSRARKSRSETGMGTTIVAVMFTPDLKNVIVGHVGDSRCYRVRNGKIGQLTNDHSLVSEVSEIAPWLTDEEVQELPTNVITRALGMAPDVVVDLLTSPTQPGDIYLLCSDGLNGMVTDEDILDILLEDRSLEDTCATLIERANSAGGVDNTTVVVAKIEEDDTDEDQPPSCVIDADDTVEVQALGPDVLPDQIPDSVPDGVPDSDRG